MNKRLDIYLLIYLLTLLIFSYFFLFIKHNVGNDSTISEWLINYEGGFTKRGFIGQIAIELSRYFQTNLRWMIFLLQSFTLTLYFILLFNLLKHLHYERIIILSIFTPIFILYPVAEIEVLARKEVIVFTLFLTYLFIPRNSNYKIFSFTIFLVLAILIWEPIVFFFPLIFLFEIIENKIENIDKKLIKLILSFLPSFLIALLIIFDPITPEQHKIMVLTLKNEFGESCYMSCGRLITVSSIAQQFQGQIERYSLEVFVRYSLIIFIGFFPLFILFRNSKLNNKKLFLFKNFNNPINTFYLGVLPVSVLFAMGFDWGRWVNIFYVILALIYFQLLIKEHLTLNLETLRQNFLYKIKGKAFVILFILFCFGWNPKTVITGDVASFPGYRIPYKVFKTLSN